MPSRRHDQAEGLRRMTGHGTLRVVSLGAGEGGSARTMAIINLAGALAELGRDVLVLDESPTLHGVTATLGLKARFDLEDVIRRKRDLDEVIVRGPAGIKILPVACGARSLAQLPASEQQWLVERCGRLGFAVDTLLMDAVPGSASALVWPGVAAQEVIIIGGGGANAVTAAYALIKRLSSESGRREFHVMVSNVTSEREGRIVCGNVARVARRYLQVSLDFVGHVPPDDKMWHAASMRLPVVAAFPTAAAAESFRRLAQVIIASPRAEYDGSGFDDFMRNLIQSSRVHIAAVQISP